MHESQEQIIAGRNSVIETLHAQSVNKVYIQKDKKDQTITKLASQNNVPVVYVERHYLDQLTNKANHQGVALSVAPISYLSIEELMAKHDLNNNPMFLILDEVQDVHNLGAILRVCDAFQIEGIILNKRRSAPVNATVSKISTGAINYVDICRVNNLVQAIEKLKANGYWIADLDMHGNFQVNDNIYERPLAVIIGGEDKGVSKMMKKHSDMSITIPMQGHVNSLNVSCAVTILGFEHMRGSKC